MSLLLTHRSGLCVGAPMPSPRKSRRHRKLYGVYLCSPPHRAGPGSQVCCEARRKVGTAPWRCSTRVNCRRSACHCLLGSYSDSLPASLPAGSSARGGVMVDTLLGTVGSVIGGRKRGA